MRIRWLAAKLFVAAMAIAVLPSLAEKRPMAELRPAVTFTLGGDPDWMAVSDDSVWVTVSGRNRVIRLDAKSNRSDLTAEVNRPCSGLAAGFASLWIPSCADRSLVRVDLKTGSRQATIAASPA